MASDDARPIPVEGVFELGPFRFESGESLPSLRVGYAMFGRPNAARDNVVLLMPGTSNLRHSPSDYIGPGRAFDTDRFCVVSTDAIGGGTSSQPGDGLRGDFPRYRVRDLVAAQVELVCRGLGLGDTPLAAVAGASMGAFQALEWAIHHPRTTRAAVLLVPATRAGQVVRQTTARMGEIVRLDPRWRDGAYTEPPLAGLRLAGRHYYAWTVSDEHLEVLGAAALAQAEAVGERFAQWDAWSLLRRYECSTAHDVAEPFGGDLGAALGRIQARVLVLPCRQDRLLGYTEGVRIAQGVPGAQLVTIDSPLGHMAWRPVPGSPVTDQVTRAIRDFLA